MIILPMEQRTPEWYAAKAGIPSASCADMLVTPTGRPSAQLKKYALQLAAEVLMGKSDDTGFQSAWMQRGVEVEEEARNAFSMRMDCELLTPGFVLGDDGFAGCSPDALFELDNRYEGLELKCPSPRVHLEYLLAGTMPSDYVPQVQFSMMVTGAKRWHFCSYHPDMPMLVLQVARDESFIGTLKAAVAMCTKERDSHLATLQAKGVMR